MNYLRYIFITLFCLISIGIGAFFFFVNMPWIDLSTLEYYNPGKPSIVLDDQGNELMRFQSEPRKFINFEKIPKNIINAFIASEDNKFFSHTGISIKGIIRSIVKNIWKGKRSQGASTITQQVVRLLFFNQQKTFKRKIKEQILAISVERQFTKELILETYLNHIYFGHGVYGIGRASEKIWNKPVSDLTLAEIAVLPTIITSPQRNWPTINPERTIKRRNTVLKKMLNLELISKKDFDKAINKSLNINSSKKISNPSLHLREEIRLFVEKKLSKKELYNGGLVIQTTINKRLQKIAHRTFRRHIRWINRSLELKNKSNKNKKIEEKSETEAAFVKKPEKDNPVDGGLISINPKTGSVKALVGGYDFKSSQLNRAINTKRQMGSSIKPIIYATAIESGSDFDHVSIDEPLLIEDQDKLWEPKNYNKKFEGPITLAKALILSKNTIAVKILLKAGIENVVKYLKRLQISENICSYPSISLGCIETSALKSAAAFASFANKGIYNKPYIILWIKNGSGKKVFKHQPETKRIFSWKTASKIKQVLNLTFERMHKMIRYKIDENFKAFGKTGTTNDSRTCWYTGSTELLTTTIYVGRDNNKPLGKRVYPIHNAFPMWLDFYKVANLPPHKLDFDPNLKKVQINAYTGKIIKKDSKTSKNTRSKYISKNISKNIKNKKQIETLYILK